MGGVIRPFPRVAPLVRSSQPGLKSSASGPGVREEPAPRIAGHPTGQSPPRSHPSPSPSSSLPAGLFVTPDFSLLILHHPFHLPPSVPNPLHPPLGRGHIPGLPPRRPFPSEARHPPMGPAPQLLPAHGVPGPPSPAHGPRRGRGWL
ncbi:hypothetical protein FB451DRAFT_1376852 [Mycena latifolia]|nr:hypothetical protein FB451DRAFT_1376852 [Mycena latifolia]